MNQTLPSWVFIFITVVHLVLTLVPPWRIVTSWSLCWCCVVLIRLFRFIRLNECSSAISLRYKRWVGLGIAPSWICCWWCDCWFVAGLIVDAALISAVMTVAVVAFPQSFVSTNYSPHVISHTILLALSTRPQPFSSHH